MTYTIKSIYNTPSRYTDTVDVIEFTDDQGNTLKTYTDPSYKNYKHWKTIIENKKEFIGAICEGLRTKSDTLVNADYAPDKIRVSHLLKKEEQLNMF